ncbi:hypothetical protein O181_054291 [Austropuccinia psidii MF-1]|uniref:Uncharacterized protein n=1 Tax=Austropuccinia psidii MF-1 TaxID=1389203 RepID=A0A9Q3E296_9BASI|nr:hypothetical protein [Austropuccinia psidii MF-1]
MEIDKRKNFRFSEWETETGTLDSGNTDSERTETSILGISSSELHNEFLSAVLKSYAKHKQCGMLLGTIPSTKAQESRAGTPAQRTLVEGLQG